MWARKEVRGECGQGKRSEVMWARKEVKTKEKLLQNQTREFYCLLNISQSCWLLKVLGVGDNLSVAVPATRRQDIF